MSSFVVGAGRGAGWRRSAVAVMVTSVLVGAGLVIPGSAAVASGCTITGTDRADTLTGTEGSDVLCGLGGDDVLIGLGGDDVLIGGTGSDLLEGGDGADTLTGGNEHDRLLGGDGDDILQGDTGFDVLIGGDGNDTLDGGNDADTLLGGAGDDTLDGALGIDVLHGGSGDDVLIGGNDQDSLYGGAGGDTITGNLGNDLLVGGSGDDSLDGGQDQDVCDGGTGQTLLAGCERQTSDPAPDSDDEGDRDGDGLDDEAEITAGTNPDSVDSDGDGLSDAEEILTLTDPTSRDSDGDGTADGAEDTDADGVDNAGELVDDTIPFHADSDDDGLDDGAEKNLGTNPLVVDSDGDGLSDGDEVALGTDPLVADTDADGVTDGAESFTREVSDEASGAQLVVTGPGATVLAASMRQAEDAEFAEVPGLASGTVVVDAPGTTSGTLTMPFDPSAVPGDHDIAVLHFDEETGTFDRPGDQTIDRTAGTVTVTTSDFSPFVVVDITAFTAAWQQEIVTPREGGGAVASIDAALVLDESGSMGWNDPSGLRRDAAKSFVDALLAGDRAAAIGFDTSSRVLQPLTDDLDAVKTAIDRIAIRGGTSITAAVSGGLDELDVHGVADHQRIIVLLTDGEGPYDTSLTQRAVDSDTTIYTVGLGSSVDEALLGSIATATGGKFFYVADASGLGNAFERVGGDLGAPDTDGDGIADVAETAGWRDGVGRVHVTDPTRADTDGDGLSDGEEAGPYSTGGTFGVGTYYRGYSDPTRADSDADGLGDAQELELGTTPQRADTDLDGLSDLTEVGAGFDPLTFNTDGDSKFDDEEMADGTDPFGYDLEGRDNAHAALSGFWFGDAWDSGPAKWAQVNIDVASSPWYLAGQAASGFVLIGDLRDLLYGIGTANWDNAAWAAVGVIPYLGDTARVVREAVQFAAKSTRAVRAAVEFVTRNLPERYVDDVVEVVGKIANSRLARDAAVAGRNAPDANYDLFRGWTRGKPARISKDPVQAAQLQAKLDELKRLFDEGRRVDDVRVNQRQVTRSGEQAGINRPDLQYTLDGKRYYVEWDRPLCSDPTRSLRGDLHGERIYANDSTIDYATQVILIVAGACE